MNRAKKDYVKGFYRIIMSGKDYRTYNLVFTHSMTGDPTGRDMMNIDVELYTGDLKGLKEYVKNKKIKRVVWTGRETYVRPDEWNKFGGLFIVKSDY